MNVEVGDAMDCCSEEAPHDWQHVGPPGEYGFGGFPFISVQAFADACEATKELSASGGDEDWVAVGGIEWFRRNPYTPWLDSGGPFGCCDVQRHIVSVQGQLVVVLIGCHS